VSLKDIAGDSIDRHVVFGQVVGVHIDDRFIAGGRLDTAAMRPVARCGYDEYAVVDAVFRMARPSVPEAALPPRLAEPAGTTAATAVIAGAAGNVDRPPTLSLYESSR